MTQQTYNNKKVIRESRTKQIILVLGAFLFVFTALWTREQTSAVIFWGTIILFGCAGIFNLVRLLNPNNIFVPADSPLDKQIRADDEKKIQDDLGFFSYTDSGFCLKDHVGTRTYKWTDIETLFGYKEDRFTTDEICLDIFTDNNSYIRLTESTPGWYQFLIRLSQNMESVAANWDEEIALPVFATNMTLLFDRRQRSKEQARTDCYHD